LPTDNFDVFETKLQQLWLPQLMLLKQVKMSKFELFFFCAVWHYFSKVAFKNNMGHVILPNQINSHGWLPRSLRDLM